MKKILCILLSALIIMSAFAGCSSKDTDGGDDKLKVVCTLFPQYDFVREIAGDLVDIKLLLPAGTESHSFEPTPTDIVSLGDADLFIYVGENMETWVPSILSEINKDKTAILSLAASLGLTLAEHEHHEGEEEHNEDEDSGATDPHIWTNPMTAIDMVSLIRDLLIEIDAKNAEKYAENAGIYIARLKTLDSEIRQTVATAKRTEIVFGSRFAVKNFAVEYGLTYTAAFDSCTEETEPSAAAIAKIITEVKEKEIPVIFYEELIEPTTAEMLAKETGAKTLLFHSCHNLSKDDFESGMTYISLMQQNAANLAEALN